MATQLNYKRKADEAGIATSDAKRVARDPPPPPPLRRPPVPMGQKTSWENQLNRGLRPTRNADKYQSTHRTMWNFVGTAGSDGILLAEGVVEKSGLGGVGKYTDSNDKDDKTNDPNKNKTPNRSDPSKWGRFLQLNGEFDPQLLAIDSELATRHSACSEALLKQNDFNLHQLFGSDTDTQNYYCGLMKEMVDANFPDKVTRGSPEYDLVMEKVIKRASMWARNKDPKKPNQIPDDPFGETWRINFGTFFPKNSDSNDDDEPTDATDEPINMDAIKPRKTRRPTGEADCDDYDDEEKMSSKEIAAIIEAALARGFRFKKIKYVDSNGDPFPKGHFGYCEKTGKCKTVCLCCEFLTVGSVVRLGVAISYSRGKTKDMDFACKLKCRNCMIYVLYRAPESAGRVKMANKLGILNLPVAPPPENEDDEEGDELPPPPDVNDGDPAPSANVDAEDLPPPPSEQDMSYLEPDDPARNEEEASEDVDE